ncbi:MAG: glycosyltransferase family 4 protein [Lentimicrobiaceae bacterium]|nr:glycosyltransferase family 4 protein [Lentimicrobiaceae bacterium]
MTIIHVSTPDTWRGGEQQVAYLATEFAVLGIPQVVVCPLNSPLEKFCREKGITVSTFRCRIFFKLWLAYRLTCLCRKYAGAILHTHDSHAHTAAVISAFFFLNKAPLVVHRRVDFPIGKNVFSQVKYNHPGVKRILCVSDKIREITGKDIRNKKKLVTIYSGIDLQRFAKANSHGILRKQYQLTEKNLLIGNVSAIAPHKDYYTFVDTAELLSQINPDFRFFIIGDGPEKENIRNYICKKGLENRIILTGFLSNIPEILPELDVFLITSETEGLGTTLLDAFACRVPVVATAAGGIPEIVRDRVTGLLAPVKAPEKLASAVLTLLNEPQLKENLIENAFLLLQDFSTSEMAKKTLQIYKEVIKHQ